jgi:hypothetical protein
MPKVTSGNVRDSMTNPNKPKFMCQLSSAKCQLSNTKCKVHASTVYPKQLLKKELKLLSKSEPKPKPKPNLEAEAQERDAAYAKWQERDSTYATYVKTNQEAHDQTQAIAQAYAETMERATASFQLHARACKAQEREEVEAEERAQAAA